jgi:hypothetical protein
MQARTYTLTYRSNFVSIVATGWAVLGIVADWDSDLVHILGQALPIGTRVTLAMSEGSRATLLGIVRWASDRNGERAMKVQTCAAS